MCVVGSSAHQIQQPNALHVAALLPTGRRCTSRQSSGATPTTCAACCCWSGRADIDAIAASPALRLLGLLNFCRAISSLACCGVMVTRCCAGCRLCGDGKRGWRDHREPMERCWAHVGHHRAGGAQIDRIALHRLDRAVLLLVAVVLLVACLFHHLRIAQNHSLHG